MNTWILVRKVSNGSYKISGMAFAIAETKKGVANFIYFLSVSLSIDLDTLFKRYSYK